MVLADSNTPLDPLHQLDDYGRGQRRLLRRRIDEHREKVVVKCKLCRCFIEYGGGSYGAFNRHCMSLHFIKTDDDVEEALGWLAEVEEEQKDFPLEAWNEKKLREQRAAEARRRDARMRARLQADN